MTNNSVENAKLFIDQFCRQIGTTSEATFNPGTQCWHFTKGSGKILVSLVSYNVNPNVERTFIRFFSPVLKVPSDPSTRLELFTNLLELNQRYMGFKFAVFGYDQHVYMFSERDVVGMDYNEFILQLNDFGTWVDQLDDQLRTKYGAGQPGPPRN